MGITRRPGQGAPFLVELMAVILFFALSATVILTMFIKSSLRSDEAERLSAATTLAADAAELVRVAADPGADFCTRSNGSGESGFGGDPDFFQADAGAYFQPDSGDYLLRLEVKNENGVFQMSVTILHNGQALYAIDSIARYTGEAIS